MPIVPSPTDDEIIKWAYGNDPVEPCQEFHMLITGLDRSALLFKLAADPNCFNRDYFLHCLYHLSGQTVRESAVRESEAEFKELFTKAEGSGDPRLWSWLERTKFLFENPYPYSSEYDLWHSGGFVQKDEKEGR